MARKACKLFALTSSCNAAQLHTATKQHFSLRPLFYVKSLLPQQNIPGLTQHASQFSTSVYLNRQPRDTQSATPSAVQALSQPKPEKKIIDHRLIGRDDALSKIYEANNYEQQSNEDIRPDFYNRNPRNLELMNVAHKRDGWALDLPKRDHYYRLRFETSSRATSAWIEHWSGDKIVSASTAEWAIAKHLYRPSDVSAAFNIGRILGHRMLQTGIYAVNANFIDGETKNDEAPSERITSFFDGLQEFGIELQEPPRAKKPHPYKELYVEGRIKSLMGTNNTTRNPFT